MVLQVKDYGAFRHQPSTAWFVTHILRAPKTPKEKSQEKQSEHPQAKHVNISAKNGGSEGMKSRDLRVAGVLFVHLEKSPGYNCRAAVLKCLTAELSEIVQLVIVMVPPDTYSPPP